LHRCEEQGAAAQALRLAKRRYGDIEPLPRLGKGRQFGGDHHRGGVAQLRRDAGRDQHTQSRRRGFERLDGEFQVLVAGAAQADDDAIAGQRIGANARKARNVLDALGLRRRRQQ
jgi:hypothetical protein